MERKNGEMEFVPSQGDIIWLNFTPQSGHEQMGKRPALVISNDFFNWKTGFAFVCPITSTHKSYPLHVKLIATKKINGFIMVEQSKSIDYRSRGAEFIEKAGPEIIDEVLARFRACFDQ
ncbi:MAG: type II toxin-antitoxin system PemK/MazF family toxin [Bacteroidota bacterium]